MLLLPTAAARSEASLRQVGPAEDTVLSNWMLAAAQRRRDKPGSWVCYRNHRLVPRAEEPAPPEAPVAVVAAVDLGN